jgi:hypothetical protein
LQSDEPVRRLRLLNLQTGGFHERGEDNAAA